MSETLFQELLQLLHCCRPLPLQNCNKPKGFPRAITRLSWGVVASALSGLLHAIARVVASSLRVRVRSSEQSVNAASARNKMSERFRLFQ